MIRSLVGVLSGPEALCCSRSLRKLMTPGVEIMMAMLKAIKYLDMSHSIKKTNWEGFKSYIKSNCDSLPGCYEGLSCRVVLSEPLSNQKELSPCPVRFEKWW